MRHKSQRSPPSADKCSRPGFSPSRGHSNPRGRSPYSTHPKGVPKVVPPLQHTIGEANSSQPINKEEDEEEEEKEKEIVDASYLEDLHKVFYRPLSPETITSDLG